MTDTPHPLAALLRDVPRYDASAVMWTLEDVPPKPTKDGAWVRLSEVLAALTLPDDEAGKVLEGVTGDEWLRGISAGAWKVVRNRDKTLNVISGQDADGDTHKVCLVNGAAEANARFIAWCRTGVPALLAQRAADAARIRELEAELKEETALAEDMVDQVGNLLPAVNREAVEQRARAEAAEQLAQERLDHIVAAETRIAALTATVERMRGALESIAGSDIQSFMLEARFGGYKLSDNRRYCDAPDVKRLVDLARAAITEEPK